MKKILLLLLVFAFSTIYSQEDAVLIRDYFQNNYISLGLAKQDVEDFKIDSRTASEISGVKNVFVKQRYKSIEVYNSILNFSIKNNKVIYVSGHFTSDLTNKVNATSPKYSASEALNVVLESIGSVVGNITFVNKESYFIFINSLAPEESIQCTPTFNIQPDGKLRLAWDFFFITDKNNSTWSIRVDAITNAILEKNDLTARCKFQKKSQGSKFNEFSFSSKLFKEESILAAIPNASYRVLPYRIMSPLHGDRQLITSPHDITASPYGWHDNNKVLGNEYTTTQGANVHAYDDIDGSNSTTGQSADGGSSLVFDFPYGGVTVDPSNYINAATTNLFYMNNIMHDIFYRYGFNESNGNFQNVDYVKAESQDGSGINNANFSTPIDGNSGRMQMYLWNYEPEKKLFEITSPSDLIGTYRSNDNAFTDGHVALPTRDNAIEGSLVLVVDDATVTDDGCTSIINGTALNGNIALIKRGTCNYVTKVINAQNAGAKAVIIMNNVDGDIVMGGGDASIVIPAISISKTMGEMLAAKILNNPVNLKLYLDPFVNSDGDFDNSIIAHEYGHGISTRLTGGPNNSSCLQYAEQMGEGWSDFFSLMLQMKSTDLRSDAIGLGCFVMSEPSNGSGIRDYKYSTDMVINPLTFASTNTMFFNNGNGDVVDVHSVGSVWASMLWDLAWDYRDKYGFDDNIYTGTKGNNKVLQLVIEALRIQPCNPSFVQARNAIIQADKNLTGGLNECIIWNAFARRGLGVNADSKSNNNTVASIKDQLEDFSKPACTLGLNYFDDEDLFKISPNPSNGNVTISISNYSGVVQLELFDCNGRKVWSQETNFTNEYNAQFSSISAGVYFLKIIGNGLLHTSKLLVN